MPTVYFDYNATTPLDAAVREAMLPFLGEIWGNPSSIHRVGRRAPGILDDAHDRAARVLGCKPSEIVFTSGGTESANLAVLGAARLLKLKAAISSPRPLNTMRCSTRASIWPAKRASISPSCRSTAKVGSRPILSSTL